MSQFFSRKDEIVKECIPVLGEQLYSLLNLWEIWTINIHSHNYVHLYSYVSCQHNRVCVVHYTWSQ